MTGIGVISLSILCLSCIVPILAIRFVFSSRRRRTAAGAIAVDGGYLFPSNRGLYLQPNRLSSGLVLLFIGLFLLLLLGDLIGTLGDILTGKAVDTGNAIISIAFIISMGVLFRSILRIYCQFTFSILTSVCTVQVGKDQSLSFNEISGVYVQRGTALRFPRSRTVITTLEIGVCRNKDTFPLISVSGDKSTVIDRAISVASMIVGSIQEDLSGASLKHFQAANWEEVMNRQSVSVEYLFDSE